MHNEPTVYIVDDDEALCSSLSWLLQSVGLKSVIYNRAQDYLNAFDSKQHGCILLDIRMPQMSGLQLQEKLVELKNPLPIIIITGHGDIPIAVRAMKAGAMDFITKPFNDQLLIDLIQKALELDSKRLAHAGASDIDQRLAQLTPREFEVMEKVVEGKLNKQIASELNISIKTVELHRSRVMDKMKAKTLADLVKMSYALLQRA